MDNPTIIPAIIVSIIIIIIFSIIYYIDWQLNEKRLTETKAVYVDGPETGMLYEIFPYWIQTVNSDNFKGWLKSQTDEDVILMGYSEDQRDSIILLFLYVSEFCIKGVG